MLVTFCSPVYPFCFRRRGSWLMVWVPQNIIFVQHPIFLSHGSAHATTGIHYIRLGKLEILSNKSKMQGENTTRLKKVSSPQHCVRSENVYILTLKSWEWFCIIGAEHRLRLLGDLHHFFWVKICNFLADKSRKNYFIPKWFFSMCVLLLSEKSTPHFG